MSKALIFAPFWGQVGHVGNIRIERFVRWLSEAGYDIVIVRAGPHNGKRREDWGLEIMIRDPLGLYNNKNTVSFSAPSARRKPNKIRLNLIYWIFFPDPTIVFAVKAARDSTVIDEVAGSCFILSSSPPESSHVGAWLLSRKLGLPHIVDMRDGWLDEPLKPLLISSAFRRWQEGYLEAAILRHASAIQVTSETWRDLLCKRYPGLGNKVTILTNGYPAKFCPRERHAPREDASKLLLIHAGRFSASRLTQSPEYLLNALLEGVRGCERDGVIRLIGSEQEEVRTILDRFCAPFKEQGWEIECQGHLPREELLDLLPEADGLLLLSASFAAIPSKIFEYIPTGRPILVAVTMNDSAASKISHTLPQAFVVNSSKVNYSDQVKKFLEACTLEKNDYRIPKEFSDRYLSSVMLDVVRSKRLVS